MSEQQLVLPPNVLRRLRCAVDHPEHVMIACVRPDGSSVSSSRSITVFPPVVAIGNGSHTMSGYKFLLNGIDVSKAKADSMGNASLIVRVKRSSSARKSVAIAIAPLFQHAELNQLMADAEFPEAVYDAFAYTIISKQQALELPKISLLNRIPVTIINSYDQQIDCSNYI